MEYLTIMYNYVADKWAELTGGLSPTFKYVAWGLFVAALLLVFLVSASYAQTAPYITYSDGTIYELGEGEFVYISDDPFLYKYPVLRPRDMGLVLFPVEPEAEGSVYEPGNGSTANPLDDLDFASPEWCAEQRRQLDAAGSGGYSFGESTYNKYCG